MNAKFLISLLIAAGALLASQAYAASGTLIFHGKVTTQTCSINGRADTPADITVMLPTVPANALKAAGSTAGYTPFSIHLTACDPKSGRVQAHFESGTTTDPQTGNLILENGPGSGPAAAGNVQIGLLNADGTPIRLGGSNQGVQGAVINDKGEATLNYAAQYVAIGAAQGGIASTRVIYTLVYP